MANNELTDDELTFASAGVAGTHYARCWGCMYDQHYDPPKRHDWADEEDIKHAETTGQPSPKGKRCACWCSDADVS